MASVECFGAVVAGETRFTSSKRSSHDMISPGSSTWANARQCRRAFSRRGRRGRGVINASLREVEQNRHDMLAVVS